MCLDDFTVVIVTEWSREAKSMLSSGESHSLKKKKEGDLAKVELHA